MIPIKNKQEIEKMREACKIAATVLDRLAKMVEPGMNTYDLDQEGKKLLAQFGAQSACYNYNIGNRFYPAHTCLSVNEEVVHGIGRLDRTLKEGDIITVDVCAVVDGWIGDNAKTVAVGEVPEEIQRLLKSTEDAFDYALKYARRGKRVGDISASVQRFCENRGLGVVREFVGHGVGRTMHEEPQIPNFGRKGTGPRLAPGMTLCIEPMVTLGHPKTEVAGDGWTALTVDRSPAAHYEHTVLITVNGPEILTIPETGNFRESEIVKTES
jgi:methionyl aminopeptidase